MSKILIRADGGKNIGLGHIMRTLVLAKELERECEVFYICKNSNEYLLHLSLYFPIGYIPCTCGYPTKSVS